MKNLTPTGGDGDGCAVESKRQFTIIIFSSYFFLKLIETLEFSFTIIIHVQQRERSRDCKKNTVKKKKEKPCIYP